VVALFNTLSKFSAAIHHFKEMTRLRYTAYVSRSRCTYDLGEFYS